MKRYIRSYEDSSIVVKRNPLFVYFDIYKDDESFMRDYEVSEEDLDGFKIGDTPEGYEGYKVIAHAVAKDKYADALAADGYDQLEIYDDGDGYQFFGMTVGGRLYDVTAEIKDAVREAGSRVQASTNDDANSWPEKLTYDEYEEGDQLIEGLIKAVEIVDIFEEPSAQGGIGDDVFYDVDTGKELARIDLQEETEILKKLYYQSKDADDYANKVADWLRDYCRLR